MLELTNENKKLMWELFLNLGKKALYSTHYDLFEETKTLTPMHWREFLMLPEVVEHIRTEMEIIRKSAMNELLANAGDSNSVGKAQLMNAIAKYDEDNTVKDGPVFIYTYVPLNPEQKKAPNTIILETDIFKKQEESPFND